MHELGLAFDLHINDESQLSDLGQVWEEQMGGVWGGHFRDPIHFEAGGDLSDYKAQVVQDAVQSAVAAPNGVPGYITSGTELIRDIPIVGAPAVALSEALGLDPTSTYKLLKGWGWF
jgi:hypothetical protein